MKKKITFEIETQVSKEAIEFHIKNWLRDNFQVPESAVIKIEDVE